MRVPPVAWRPFATRSEAFGQLAYYTDMTDFQASDLIQIILRDHGFTRREDSDEPWSIYWYSGELKEYTVAPARLTSTPPEAQSH